MENSAIVRLRPTLSLSERPAQAYKTLASDEIELESGCGLSAHRHHRPRIHGRLIPLSPARKESLWTKAWADIKSFPWGRFFVHLCLLLMMSFLIIVVFLMAWNPSLFTGGDDDFCKPDGSFDLSFNEYDPWKRQGIFAINIKFGSYNFGEAKLIDVSWDVVREN